MTNLNEMLTVLTIHNEEMMKRVDGDQSRAVGLITFYHDTTGVVIWNPFKDNTLRAEVVPTDEYSETELQHMVSYLLPAEHWDTGGNCTATVYKLETPFGGVKSIGVTDDCIVGFADESPFEVDEPTEIWVRHID